MLSLNVAPRTKEPTMTLTTLLLEKGGLSEAILGKVQTKAAVQLNKICEQY